MLTKHRRYLKSLELKKNCEVEELMMVAAEKENRTRVFKENASKQRQKIRTLKECELENEPHE